jgi:phosphatidylserine decarboxylase precursor
MPAAGSLAAATYLPGALFSVNQATAAGVERLFARNERLACLFDGPDGRFASVMVGAMIVAGIETVWHGRWPTHTAAPQRLRQRQNMCGRWGSSEVHLVINNALSQIAGDESSISLRRCAISFGGG